MADYRLTPGMASRWLQVVSFVLQYIRRWGTGPSYGEIAGALGLDRTTARDHVRRAVARGDLMRSPGEPCRSLRPAPPLQGIIVQDVWRSTASKLTVDLTVPLITGGYAIDS